MIDAGSKGMFIVWGIAVTGCELLLTISDNCYYRNLGKTQTLIGYYRSRFGAMEHYIREILNKTRKSTIGFRK